MKRKRFTEELWWEFQRWLRHSRSCSLRRLEAGLGALGGGAVCRPRRDRLRYKRFGRRTGDHDQRGRPARLTGGCASPLNAMTVVGRTSGGTQVGPLGLNRASDIVPR